MSKIIVTGAAGFIGSNIVSRLNNNGLSNILLVDDVTNENVANVSDLRFNDFVSIEEMFTNMDKLVQEGDTILHHGAISDTMYPDPCELMKKNLTFSKKLFDKSIDVSARLIYASSAAVYGLGNNGFKEEKRELCEKPLNVYAFSKLCFDRYVREASKKRFQSQVVGLRYFNVYGNRELHKGSMASPFCQFTKQAHENGVIKVFEGSKLFLRDFVSVDDVVNANLYFMKNENHSGIFNVGTGIARSFLDVAKIVSNETKKEIKEIEFPKELKGRYQNYTCADLKKLKACGFNKSFKSIEESGTMYVRKLFESLSQQPK